MAARGWAAAERSVGPAVAVEPPQAAAVVRAVAEGAHASTVPDSRMPGRLAARFKMLAPFPENVSAGDQIELTVSVQNTGDTLWLAAVEPRAGIVMPAVQICDEAGQVISEIHGEPVLPHAVAPGEIINLNIRRIAPHRSGRYGFKLDLVDQHVCWFAERGSEPLAIPFAVT